MKKRIVFIHLFNNYSGSPKVLRDIILLARQEYEQVEIHTSKGGGFLSHIEGVSYKRYKYQPSSSKLFTLMLLCWVQMRVFFRLLKYRSAETTFYVNTVLPFGGLLAAKFSKGRCICHVHESYIKPKAFLNFLIRMINYAADKVIFVSYELRKDLPGIKKEGVVIHNALSSEFLNEAQTYTAQEAVPKVLMISSLKTYKGVFDFIELACSNQDFAFELIIGDDQKAIDDYFSQEEIPDNLVIYPRQKDVIPFYQRNSFIINMSDPVVCKESFGLTLLEGMAYGCIPLGPSAGGIKELIIHGKNGYFIHPKKYDAIGERMRSVIRDAELYRALSAYAKVFVAFFGEDIFQSKIADVFHARNSESTRLETSIQIPDLINNSHS